MESDAYSSSEEQDNILSKEEISKWKVKELKKWLEEHNLKKSGSKDVLVNRVFRKYNSGNLTSDSDTPDEDEPDLNTSKEDFCNLTGNDWIIATNDNLPTITDRDIENYFMFQKNPLSGLRARFHRHMKKGKKAA